MSNKLIKAPATLESKIRVVSFLMKKDLSETEIKCLVYLIPYGTSIHLSADLADAIKREAGLSDSAFSTALHRLEKKDVITRSGKTMTLSLMFNGISELEKLVISFESLSA